MRCAAWADEGRRGAPLPSPDGAHDERGRLDYDNAVLSDGPGSMLRFTARLSGPAAEHLERVVAPLSALGQRRRMARLARLAELFERRAS